MNKAILFLLLLLFAGQRSAQNIYFPPLTGNEWEELNPAALGWDTSKIRDFYDFAELKNSKAILVLKDGRIVIEKYFGSFNADSIWYWASAGKTLTAFLVGQAIEEGLFSLTDTTSSLLGYGWTSLTPDQEKRITVLNQLTMTTGLDDGVFDPYCTLPGCLIYKAAPGTRWAYHNAPYTLLDSVIINTTGQTYNQYFFQKIRNRTGMNGLWMRQGYNNVYFSNARSMARFGILIQNKGIWNNDTLMSDTSYYRNMLNTSQNLNKSYGYLWWLNGKESYMLPQSQIVFPGSFAPDAPSDMFSALGKNGQIISISPSKGIILIRMGDVPDSSTEVPTTLCNSLWRELNKVMTPPSGVSEETTPRGFELLGNFPNPFNPQTVIRFSQPERGVVSLEVMNIKGEKLTDIFTGELGAGIHDIVFNGAEYPSGMYLIRLSSCTESGECISATLKALLIK